LTKGIFDGCCGLKAIVGCTDAGEQEWEKKKDEIHFFSCPGCG
jgi:hypothetical protein